MKELEKLSGCITFLGHNIVDMYRAKCDCRCSRKGRTTSRARTMSSTMPHVFLLVESALNVRTVGSGSKVSLLSRMARSVLSVYALK